MNDSLLSTRALRKTYGRGDEPTGNLDSAATVEVLGLFGGPRRLAGLEG